MASGVAGILGAMFDVQGVTGSSPVSSTKRKPANRLWFAGFAIFADSPFVSNALVTAALLYPGVLAELLQFPLQARVAPIQHGLVNAQRFHQLPDVRLRKAKLHLPHGLRD